MLNAQNNLNKQRGVIGASQSRITVAQNNLQARIENIKSAESRIRDVDVANESSNLIRSQILRLARNLRLKHFVLNL